LVRQKWLEEQGWVFLRLTNEDVLSDVEAVAIAIARHLGVEIRKPKRTPK
jgi:very-short-patch-repair endonuclease